MRLDAASGGLAPAPASCRCVRGWGLRVSVFPAEVNARSSGRAPHSSGAVDVNLQQNSMNIALRRGLNIQVLLVQIKESNAGDQLISRACRTSIMGPTRASGVDFPGGKLPWCQVGPGDGRSPWAPCPRLQHSAQVRQPAARGVS
jgi:hypothetical protein